jgi:hypothetical protein
MLIFPSPQADADNGASANSGALTMPDDDDNGASANSGALTMHADATISSGTGVIDLNSISSSIY